MNIWKVKIKVEAQYDNPKLNRVLKDNKLKDELETARKARIELLASCARERARTLSDELDSEPENIEAIRKKFFINQKENQAITFLK